jgi:hypothetical protein
MGHVIADETMKTALHLTSAFDTGAAVGRFVGWLREDRLAPLAHDAPAVQVPAQDACRLSNTDSAGCLTQTREQSTVWWWKTCPTIVPPSVARVQRRLRDASV